MGPLSCALSEYLNANSWHQRSRQVCDLPHVLRWQTRAAGDAHFVGLLPFLWATKQPPGEGFQPTRAAGDGM
jgi:hypothetical protein